MLVRPFFRSSKWKNFCDNFETSKLCNSKTYKLSLPLNFETKIMNKLLIVGTVAFDAIETPFGKTDKILGGAGTYIGLSASFFNLQSAIVSVVGDDFPQEYLDDTAGRDAGNGIIGRHVVGADNRLVTKEMLRSDIRMTDILYKAFLVSQFAHTSMPYYVVNSQAKEVVSFISSINPLR